MAYRSVTLGFVGVGTISAAVVRGLCGDTNPPSSVILSPRGSQNVAGLQAEFGNIVTVAESNQAVVDAADWVIVAVLTSQAREVMSALNFRADQTIISLMASIDLTLLSELALPATNPIKAIPLPPVQFRQGITLLTPPGTPATDMFRTIGTAVEARDEKELQTMMPMTCVMGIHYQFMASAAQWLTSQGVPDDSAATLVSGVYNTFNVDATMGVSAAQEGKGAAVFEHLVAEQTPGGLNEGNIKRLSEAGAFSAFQAALDATLKGLRG